MFTLNYLILENNIAKYEIDFLNLGGLVDKVKDECKNSLKVENFVS